MYRLNCIVSRNTQDLKTLAKALRSVQQAQFSNKSSLAGEESSASVNETKTANAFEVVPPIIEREISLFGPKDLRAPLPGNVGLVPGHPVNRNRKINYIKSFNRGDVFSNTDILTSELAADRYVRIADQAFYPQFSDMPNDSVESSELKSTDVMECVAHQCPSLLAKDFQELFPHRSLGNQTTVITICQKANNDMSAWSPAMEVEREELMEQFIEVAQEIVNKLNHSGYWADFIDPFSCGPFHSKYSNAVLYETDERFRHFGFEIEDLGCCKVTRHHKWGSRSFVGSLFTNAPIGSDVLKNILRTLGSSTEPEN